MRARLLAPAAIAASAAAFTLYARIEWPWVLLGWCGLVPWLAALDRAPTLPRALGSALFMCEAFVLGVFLWFGAAIATYTGAPLAVGLCVLLLLGPLLLQPQFFAFAAARHLSRRWGVGWWGTAFTGACAYVGAEWASPKLFGDTIGHGLFAAPLLRQAADLAGAHGLTFVLVLANACLYQALAALRPAAAPARRRALALPALSVVLLVGGLLTYGMWRSRDLADSPAGPPVRAGIVQADISHYEELAAEIGTFDAVRVILDAYFALSAGLLEGHDGPAVDLLVWPETVYPTTFGAPKSPAGGDFDRAIASFVNDAGVPLVFGAYDAEDGDEFNAAVFLQPSAGQPLAFDTYRKASLFPLTERVPAVLEGPALRRWLPWLGTWKAGAGPRVLPLRLSDGRTLRIAPLICYDAVNPRLALAAVRAGADLIVTLSNDAWFAAGGGPRLHLVVSAFRSIETRRAQLRATNTGISAVITPSGELLGTIGVDQRATLAEAVMPDRHTWTLMLAWGDWFGPTALAAALVLLAIAWHRRAPGGASGSPAPAPTERRPPGNANIR